MRNCLATSSVDYASPVTFLVSAHVAPFGGEPRRIVPSLARNLISISISNFNPYLGEGTNLLHEPEELRQTQARNTCLFDCTALSVV